MNEILCRQMAVDYCCSTDAVLDHKNHFTRHEFLPAWAELATSPVKIQNSPAGTGKEE